MELEEAIEGLNSLKIIFEIDNGANFEATPVTQKEIANEIKVVLNHLKKQEKMIDELKNGIHYQKCIICGKEIRVKRTDAKYCDECAKLRQKDYFKNLSDEKKKQRAEKSKIYMRELRAKRKAEEIE